MGQKVNPIGMRLGVNRTWTSRWFTTKGYAEILSEDLKLREYIKKRLKQASVSEILIERAANRTTVTVYSARPGVIIGRKGADIENLRKDLMKRLTGEVSLNIIEVKKPDLEAQLVAESIAQALERRVAFRRAMKKSISQSMKSGALGIKVACAGRLGGAEIARTEWYREGRIPLHTLRADIDYALVEAHTTYGVVGVKVWIYRGDKNMVAVESNSK